MDPVEMERLADAAADRAHSRFIVSADPGEVAAEIAYRGKPRLRTSSSTPQARTSAASSTGSAPTSCRSCASRGRASPGRRALRASSAGLAERLAIVGAGHEEAHAALVDRERRDRDVAST